MKLIIAGGRNYLWTPGREQDLANWLQRKGAELVISGGATGADAFGEAAAKRAGIPAHVEKADWKQFGNAAGPLRNRKMASMADAVMLFPGGRGTASMLKEAQAVGLKVFDMRNKWGM